MCEHVGNSLLLQCVQKIDELSGVIKEIELVIQQLRRANYQSDVNNSCLHVPICEHVGNSPLLQFM